jgi:hypothetical protein
MLSSIKIFEDFFPGLHWIYGVCFGLIGRGENDLVFWWRMNIFILSFIEDL